MKGTEFKTKERRRTKGTVPRKRRHWWRQRREGKRRSRQGQERSRAEVKRRSRRGQDDVTTTSRDVKRTVSGLTTLICEQTHLVQAFLDYYVVSRFLRISRSSDGVDGCEREQTGGQSVRATPS